MILALCAGSVLGQDTTSFFITANANLLTPTPNSGRSTYPIYGINGDLERTHMIGGFGLGMSMTHPFSEKLHVKTYLNLSRIKYWDESLVFKLANPVYFIGTSYVSMIGGLVQLEVPGDIKIGTGISAQVLWKANTKSVLSNLELEYDVNVYKRVVPVLPIAVEFHNGKMQYTVRYDHLLTNMYKNSLSDNFMERYGLVFFTAGRKI